MKAPLSNNRRDRDGPVDGSHAEYKKCARARAGEHGKAIMRAQNRTRKTTYSLGKATGMVSFPSGSGLHYVTVGPRAFRLARRLRRLRARERRACNERRETRVNKLHAHVSARETKGIRYTRLRLWCSRRERLRAEDTDDNWRRPETDEIVSGRGRHQQRTRVRGRRITAREMVTTGKHNGRRHYARPVRVLCARAFLSHTNAIRLSWPFRFAYNGDECTARVQQRRNEPVNNSYE